MLTQKVEETSPDLSESFMSVEHHIMLPPQVEERRSFFRTQYAPLLAAAVVALGMALVTFKNLTDTPPPGPTTKFSAPGTQLLPLRNEPIADVFQKLGHPEDVQRFLEENVKYRAPDDAQEFLGTYRMSAEDFLKTGHGPCNCYAQFWSEWLHSKGARPVFVRITPTVYRTWDWEDVAALDEDAVKKLDSALRDWDWRKTHELVMVKTGDGFIAFDNDTYREVKNCATVEEAVKALHYEHYTLLWQDGVQEFRPDSPLSRMMPTGIYRILPSAKLGNAEPVTHAHLITSGGSAPVVLAAAD